MERHVHCKFCGREVESPVYGSKGVTCAFCAAAFNWNDGMTGAMRRKQDQDWASWTPKQREQAHQNGEYYGEDRLLEQPTRGKGD